MGTATSRKTLCAAALEVRTDEPTVLAAGRPVALSQREYRLLVALARRPDRVVSRSELFRSAWNAALRDGDRSVDVYVRRLRVKLAAALPGWRYIHTHFGFGYRFSAEPAEAGSSAFSHPVHKDAASSGETVLVSYPKETR